MEIATGIEIGAHQLACFCVDHGIRRLRLFGSALRDGLRADSDIDLLVDFEVGEVPGLIALSSMELTLGEMFGRSVDLRTLGDLSPLFRDEVADSARTIYPIP